MGSGCAWTRIDWGSVYTSTNTPMIMMRCLRPTGIRMATRSGTAGHHCLTDTQDLPSSAGCAGLLSISALP